LQDVLAGAVAEHFPTRRLALVRAGGLEGLMGYLETKTILLDDTPKEL